MYRIALLGFACVSLAGCALNTSAITSGFAGNPSSTASISGSSSLGGDTGTSSKSANVKTARLDDKAPSGTYEKAPSGALSDRDYSHTQLNVDKARDIINQYRRDNGLKPLALSAECRYGADYFRRSHEGLEEQPWPQQEPAVGRRAANGSRSGLRAQDGVQELLDAGRRFADVISGGVRRLNECSRLPTKAAGFVLPTCQPDQIGQIGNAITVFRYCARCRSRYRAGGARRRSSSVML